MYTLTKESLASQPDGEEVYWLNRIPNVGWLREAHASSGADHLAAAARAAPAASAGACTAAVLASHALLLAAPTCGNRQHKFNVRHRGRDLD